MSLQQINYTQIRGGTPNVMDFGAVGDGITDDTSAFTLAQAAGNYVFVPSGMNCKVQSGLNYWQFYGQGNVFEPGRQWALNPFPQTGDMSKTYNPTTYGTYETAAAQSITANSGQAQLKTNTQILGTNTLGLATTYLARDHVGQYISSYSFIPLVLSGTVTYTSTTVTNSAVNSTIKPGMIIDVQGSTVYTGMVQSVSGTIITVDGWYTQTSGTLATPPNNSTALVNPNTKVFGQNIVVSASGNGTTTGANTFSAIEFDLSTPTSSSPNSGCWGIDMSVTSGYLDIGYQMRGKRNISYFSNNAGGAGLYGFRSDGDNYAVQVNDPTISAISVTKLGTAVFNVGPDGTTQIGGMLTNGVAPAQVTTAFANVGQPFTANQYGGLYYITGFNISGGAQAKFVLAVNSSGVSSVFSLDSTGLGISFQTASNYLQIKTTSGTFQFVAFQIYL